MQVGYRGGDDEAARVQDVGGGGVALGKKGGVGQGELGRRGSGGVPRGCELVVELGG